MTSLIRGKVIRRSLSVTAILAVLGCGILATDATPTEAAPKDNFSPETRRELAEVRRATAKYNDLSKALADGYVDINVFIPQMGFHFLRPAFLDADFQHNKPELLVYAADPYKNRLQLVAVEYAVPLNLSPDGPPEGFSGSSDMWHMNEEFGLWTLHVWLWLDNPDGMFAEFNPRLP
jgi:hypothetical protein